MKKTLIYILTLLSFTAFGQDFEIESNFKPNKTYHFTLKRTKVDSREPITKELSQLTEIEATFTQVEEHFKCVWKYGEVKVVGPEDIMSEIRSEYNDKYNLYRGFEIEILFDPYIGEIKLLNYTKTKENIKKSFSKISKNQEKKIDSATLVLMHKQLEPTYSTPEMLLLTYFPEIDLYFSLYSQNFTKNIVVESEYYYPNPFGGEPLPVVGKIGIDSKEGDVLIIKNVEHANQEEVNRILKDMVEKMSKLGNSSVSKEEIPDFTLNVRSKYFYDLNIKLIKKVQLEKIIETSGIIQTHVLEVELKE